ncbi:MAG: hypothetical protein JNM88_18195 [Chitinophagaceae bacterium]|nr:hypothetical protein [Chitinophagaceae bacterium]
MTRTLTFGLSLTILLFGFTQVPVKKIHEERENIIFALLDDGTVIEPLARMENGALVPAVTGSEEADQMREFARIYYTPKTSYSLIYGGKAGGAVSVKRSNIGTECGGATAEVVSSGAKANLKGFEMALATNINPAKPASGTRRAATAAEKAAIEKLVSSEFRKNKSSLKGMKAARLTAVDANNDKKLEFIGTYIVSPSPQERGLLFFIAVKSATGTYTISYSSYNQVKKDDVMSGDLADVESGTYQEMLLDLLDTDNDGVAEVFTVRRSFEGISFSAYSWNGQEWSSILDVSNYHCAY